MNSVLLKHQTFWRREEASRTTPDSLDSCLSFGGSFRIIPIYEGKQPQCHCSGELFRSVQGDRPPPALSGLFLHFGPRSFGQVLLEGCTGRLDL